jgi:hypothetical protein
VAGSFRQRPVHTPRQVNRQGMQEWAVIGAVLAALAIVLVGLMLLLR